MELNVSAAKSLLVPRCYEAVGVSDGVSVILQQLLFCKLSCPSLASISGLADTVAPVPTMETDFIIMFALSGLSISVSSANWKKPLQTNIFCPPLKHISTKREYDFWEKTSRFPSSSFPPPAPHTHTHPLLLCVCERVRGKVCVFPVEGLSITTDVHLMLYKYNINIVNNTQPRCMLL